MAGGFTRVKDYVDTELNGAIKYSSWRKSPTQATTIGVWFDLSMSPGNPIPKYWFDATPGNAAQIKQSTDGGLFHGGNVSPANKYLKNMMVLSNTVTPLPMPMILCDYLLYYPSIDEGTTDEQFLVNNVTLPRYTDGEGVQVIAVSIASRTGGQQFRLNYTNSDGVSGRITEAVVQNNVSLVGSLVNTNRANVRAAGPFIPLQAGDKGIRSIESITMLGADVGLFSLILVKPLAQLSIRGIDAPVEVNYFKNFAQVPQIVDDAYLNFLVCPAGSMAATTIHGIMEVLWN